MRKVYLHILFALLAVNVVGQQIDQIGKGEPVKINGGINVNQVYRHNSSYANPNPYALVATGNITTSLYGWSVPLTFTWSNYEWTYTQPFNQLSLHPSYKWVTAHLGWASMSFSPWSLSGHSFAGIGVDLTPTDKLKISAMYGRLQKGTSGDSAHAVNPAYKRVGKGVNAEYNLSKLQLGASLFHAEDIYDELPADNADSLGIFPQENLILGLKAVLSLTRALKVFGEGNISYHTKDRRLSRATETNNIASSVYKAWKSGLNYNFSFATMGGSIEKVEPGYTNLGSYYTNNDYINCTLDFTTAFWKQKISLAVNTGVRENNLDGQSDQDSKDRITNMQLGFVPSDKLSFSLGYSNFYNYSYIRTVFDEVEAHTSYELMDTLSFTQINENVNLSANYNFGDKEKLSHNLMSSFMYQKAGQKQSDKVEHENSSFYNATLGYRFAMAPRAISFGLTVNYSKNSTTTGENDMLGPVASFRKSFMEKTLKLSSSISLNKIYTDGKSTGQNITGRIGLNYRLKKKHNFTLSTALSSRDSKKRGTTTNYTASLGYSYNFGWPKKEEEVE